MAIFELEIGNEDVQRVLDAVSGNYHRPESVENPDYIAALEENPEEQPPLDENGDPIPSTIENPETKGNFYAPNGQRIFGRPCTILGNKAGQNSCR